MKSMNHLFRRQPGLGFLAVVCVSAIVIVLALNRFLPVDVGSAATVLAFVCSSILMGLILLFTAFFRRIGIWLLAYLISVTALERYIVGIGIKDPKFLVINLMDSSWHEISGFISPELLFAFAVAICLCVLLVNGISLAVPTRFKDALGSLGWRTQALLFVALLGLIGASFLIKKPKLEPPQERFLQAALWPVLPNLQMLRVMKGYFTGEMQFAKKIDGVPPATEISSSFESDPDGIVVVFVFGESVRADHWGLNGYYRNTTPNLRSEPNVINFTDAFSFAVYTQASAVSMMPATTFHHPQPVGPSFVDFFRKHGFSTWSFISSRPTSVQKRLINAVEHKYLEPGDAMDLIPVIADAIPTHGTDNQFVFIYTNGNHFPYKNDYPESFGAFKPDNHNRTDLASDLERLVNAYDNAVLYTDAFLEKIIERLRERRAVLIYASDHGDALGEDGKFIRGGSMVDGYLRRIPFMIWLSPSFIASAPQVAENLRVNATLKVSHDNIYPTILSLAGIRSPTVDPELDLTSRAAQARNYEAKEGAPAGSAFHFDR